MLVEELQRILNTCHPKSNVSVQVNTARDAADRTWDIQRLNHLERVDQTVNNVVIVVRQHRQF